MKKRLSVLAFLVVCLAAPGATSTAHQATPASSTAASWDCVQAIDRDGNCVWICCDEHGCTGTPCGG